MNILITSAGRRSYLINYFKEALNGNGEVHASNSLWSDALQCADKAVITPLINHRQYIQFLIDYCLKNKIKAIIPLFDFDLWKLSVNKEKFDKHNIKLVVSDSKVINICNDKWNTYKFLKSIKINTPESSLSILESQKKIKRGLINYPLIIKPRWGTGSLSTYQVNNYHELIILFNKIKQEIASNHIKYESSQDIEKSIIIQEKINGSEYGVDIFNDLNSNYLTSVSKKKLSMRAGETDSAIIIKNKSISIIAKTLSNKLKHVANLDVDIIYNNNKYYVIDLNCRFGGQYPFSHLAGVNFPKAIINMLNQKKVNSKFLLYNTGTIGIKQINPIILKNEVS
ncbi:ATP-grasp domain-containing protein [Candidatus Beckwithbacteria bacterium]|nr:ATP-grasp domain-containing protein [Candidatus Beckwithbacteria bacterium]